MLLARARRGRNGGSLLVASRARFRTMSAAPKASLSGECWARRALQTGTELGPATTELAGPGPAAAGSRRELTSYSRGHSNAANCSVERLRRAARTQHVT